MTPGEVIRGKYRVERVLGEGGMGVVVAAWDPDLQRRVAIKFLQPALLAYPEIVQRFAREARAAARLHGEHAAHVHEVGVREDGAPFLVMEYLEGHDLTAIARGPMRPPLDRVVSWVIEASTAISEAHALGIVHRDLKPGNLFLAKRHDGTVRIKVLDFGISKVAGVTKPGVTREAIVLGTPEYMAPEQCLSSRDVDARADIWALGIVLYELCTGTVPYSGDTATQVYARILAKPLVPPRSFRPAIPAALEEVILGCLAIDRDRRIATAPELVRRLRPFLVEGFDEEDEDNLRTKALDARASRPYLDDLERILLEGNEPTAPLPAEATARGIAPTLRAVAPTARDGFGARARAAVKVVVRRATGSITPAPVSSDSLSPLPTHAVWPIAAAAVAATAVVVGFVAVVSRTLRVSRHREHGFRGIVNTDFAAS